MHDKLMRDSLRVMDEMQRSASPSRPPVAPAWHKKQFDRRVPDRQTRTQVVGHTILGVLATTIMMGLLLLVVLASIA